MHTRSLPLYKGTATRYTQKGEKRKHRTRTHKKKKTINAKQSKSPFGQLPDGKKVISALSFTTNHRNTQSNRARAPQPKRITHLAAPYARDRTLLTGRGNVCVCVVVMETIVSFVCLPQKRLQLRLHARRRCNLIETRVTAEMLMMTFYGRVSILRCLFFNGQLHILRTVLQSENATQTVPSVGRLIASFGEDLLLQECPQHVRLLADDH